MGCDIHMYVEYSDIQTNPTSDRPKYWYTWGGHINPGRDYILFGYLSKGVRYDTDKGFERRGLPNDLAWASRGDAKLYIVEDGEKTGDGSVTRSTALEWNKRCGYALHYDDNGVAKYVDHPDWHSHSWLTTKEFETAIKLCQKDKNSWGSVGVEYKALLAAMKTLEKSKTKEARVVFWFDN